jgi:hypothetical protein
MSDKPRNAMQAVLDRAARQAPRSPPPEPTRALVVTPGSPPDERLSRHPAFDRPSRRNTKLIGGHFSPELAKQLRVLAAEEDTTIQALLEEAIQLLLAKKARGRFGGAAR